MVNLIIIRKSIIRCFLRIVNIDKIDLCVICINKYLIYPNMYFIYLIYFDFVFHFGQRRLNILKSVLSIKNLTIGLLIIYNKSVIT